MKVECECPAACIRKTDGIKRTIVTDRTRRLSEFFLNERGSESERLLIDREVVDREEFGLVVNHFLSALPDHIIERGQFDRVNGACFFAHAAEDAAELVDLEFRGVFLAIIPRGFRGFDVDAVRWTNSGAHHARNAFHASRGVFVEAVHPSEVARLDPAFFDGEVLTAFFRVLHRVAGASLSEGGEEVTERGPESPENRREIDGLHRGHRLGGDVFDLVVWDAHIGVSIAAHGAGWGVIIVQNVGLDASILSRL